jgi:hypothetical protein
MRGSCVNQASCSATAPAMTTEDFSHVLTGGGEMGALMRTIDWPTTAVGPIAGELLPDAFRAPN